jgi:hypothetical protein
MNRSVSRTVLGLLNACFLAAVVPAVAASFQQASIKRIVDGKEVYIDGTPE